MAKIHVLPSVALFCCFATLSQLHFTVSSKPTGFSLKLIPRDSPESPLYPGNLTYLEKLERLIRFSKARGYYLANFSRLNSTVELTENFNLPIKRDDLFYMVVVVIGSQRTQLNLLLDTGGGLIWTQCEPCINCFYQRSPKYSPQDSTSYRKLPCNHPFCSGTNPLYRCVNNECIYSSRYADGSSTRGVASLEKFLFRQGRFGLRFIDNIVFGCSKDNQNFHFSGNGIISGVLGLSKQPDSLISQLSVLLNYRFSYCFVPFIQLLQQPGILRFGDDIPPPPGNVQTARFLTIPGRYYYYLNLLDISVGTKRVGFAPGQFAVRQDGSGGCFIDSGAVISQIDQRPFRGRSAYDEVKSLFEAYYDARHLEKETNGPDGLEVCYKIYPGYHDFATMTYHFEGADYHVEGQYVHFLNDLSSGYFCVAILRGNGVSVLGAWHQQNMRLTYDIDGLHFSPENCLSDVR